LQFLKRKNKKKKLQETKILSEIEKTLRSRLLKIVEELMGKRPVLEVTIHLVT